MTCCSVAIPGEVGLDADGPEGGHDEQRRRLQVDLVPEELVQAAIEFSIVALELPAEMVLQVSVGEAAGHPFLEGEHLPVPKRDRRGVVDQSADVQEHFLGGLLLSEVDVAPLGDEFLRLQLGPLR